MFAKQVSNKDHDEKSKLLMLNLINKSANNKDKIDYNKLSKDDILRQKRMISLKETAINNEKKPQDELTDNERNIQELVDMHLKYEKLLTEYRILYLENEEIKMQDSSQKEKIQKLTEDKEIEKEHVAELITEAERQEQIIQQKELVARKMQNEFFMYKVRIVSTMILVFAIFIGCYFYKNNYIW